MANARVLIDTSLLIDHLRRAKKERTAFYRAAGRYECVVSAITEFEFRAGATTINQSFVSALLELMPVLPFDSTCVDVAVAIYGDLRARNQLIALADLLIAATAVTHQLPLLTLNLAHFERIPSLELLDLAGL